MKKVFLQIITCILIVNNVIAQETMELFTYRIGPHKVCLLPESQGNLPQNLLIGATPQMLEKYAPYGSIPNAMNAFLLQSNGKNILIDTGIGKHLLQNLEYLDVKPGDIHEILITHMHGDHIGGMLKDGKIVFPNARVFIPQPEYDYWMNDDEMNQVPERSQGSFRNAREVISQYGDRVTLFEPEILASYSKDLLSDVKAIAAPGHTPGHTAYLIESGNARLMIWGDMMHGMALQMAHPEISVTYDVDPELAASTRQQFMEHMSEHRIPFAGMHIPFPGMGKLAKSSEQAGYVYMMF